MLGCFVCSTVSAAVLFPVMLCVVIPDIAQGTLDNTVIHLPKVTMLSCSSLHSHVSNEATIQVQGPLFGQIATLHPYNQRVYTTMCSEELGGYACNNPNMTLVGSYVSPEMSIAQGTNNQSFAVRMDLESLATVFNGIVMPCFDGSGHKARMILDADDIAITVLGYKITGLHMHQVVTCSGVRQSEDEVEIPNSACFPEDLDHKPADSSQSYELKCEAGEHDLTGRPDKSKALKNGVRGWIARKVIEALA